MLPQPTQYEFPHKLSLCESLVLEVLVAQTEVCATFHYPFRRANMSLIMTYYRRTLPHWHPPGQDIFLTWRLKDSLPPHLRELPTKQLPGERFLILDRALDRASVGPLWLRDPCIAHSTLAALRNAHDHRFIQLHAFAIMANHVHILLTPIVPLKQSMRLIKGAAARQANLHLGQTGNYFWQDESFDHWVRNPAEWQKIRTYIERNPVAAGLVARPEDFPWSRASNPIK
jgi:putative transposase